MADEFHAFPATAAGIKKIDTPSLRQDFSDLLAGAQYALDSEDQELLNTCTHGLRLMAHSLCRTIGGAASVAVIEGLAADTKVAALKPAPPIIWNDDRICDVGGTAKCIARKNNKCNQSSTGCISTGDGISAGYVWGIAMLTA